MWAQGGRAISRRGLSCSAAGVPKFKLSLNLDGVSVDKELQNERCAVALKESIVTMSSDWRADKVLHRACRADAEILCADRPNELMHECLQDNIDELDEECARQCMGYAPLGSR